MKYNNGDRVRIINYGHLIWDYDRDKEKYNTWDLQPGFVGKEATIIETAESQPGYERYKLEIDGVGNVAWFGLKQLKRV